MNADLIANDQRDSRWNQSRLRSHFAGGNRLLDASCFFRHTAIALKVFFAALIVYLLFGIGLASCTAQDQPEQKPSSQTVAPETPAPGISFRQIQTYGEPDQSHTDVIKNIRVIDENSLVSCATDGTVALWDLKSGKLVRRFNDSKAKNIYCLALTPDKKHIVAGGDGNRAVMWNLETGEEEKEWTVSSRIYSIAVAVDGKTFLVGDSAGTITHFSFDSDKPIKEYTGSEDITALIFAPDGDGFIAGDGDGHVDYWKFENQKRERRFTGLGSWTCCLQLSPDQTQLIGTDYGGTVMLWDFETKKRVWSKDSMSGEIGWIRFIDEDRAVAIDGKQYLFLIDAKTGKNTKKKIDSPSICGFDLSIDRKTIYCGGKSLVCGWDIESGSLVYPSKEAYQRAGPVNQIAVHDQVVYSLGGSPTILGRDLTTGQLVSQFDIESFLGNQKPVNASLMVVEGKLIVSTSLYFHAIDLARPTDKPVKLKVALTGTCVAPGSKKLIGFNRTTKNIEQFEAATPRQRKMIAVPDPELKRLETLGQRYLVEQTKGGVAIYSYEQGKKVASQTINFQPDFLKVSENMILIGDEKNLIGFASSKILSDSSLSDSEISMLIQQLSAAKYDQRERAMLRLAGGGESILDKLRAVQRAGSDLEPEQRSRLLKVSQLIEGRGLPNLKKPATSKLGGPFEAIAVHPNGEFWLAVTREDWKSKLHSGQITKGRFTNVESQPLRSRATTLKFLENGDSLMVGYADGSIDRFAIELVD